MRISNEVGLKIGVSIEKNNLWWYIIHINWLSANNTFMALLQIHIDAVTTVKMTLKKNKKKTKF